jgi:hypothetical protein
MPEEICGPRLVRCAPSKTSYTTDFLAPHLLGGGSGPARGQAGGVGLTSPVW